MKMKTSFSYHFIAYKSHNYQSLHMAFNSIEDIFKWSFSITIPFRSPFCIYVVGRFTLID